MPRRYVAVNTQGKPTQIFDRVSKAVRAENLTRMIPAVKFERKPRGQFYVFLAVEGTEATQIPDVVRAVLQQAGLTGTPLGPIEPAAIKPMTDPTELETHSLNALTYKSLWADDPGDPFDLSATASDEKDPGDPSLGERYDQLLYWLSANAEGTWQTFARVCHVLQLADDTNQTRSIFRRLTLLGYIESSGDGQKWSICPTTLVQCAADPDGCFLTGQRTPKLVEQFNERWQVESIPQPDYQGPSRVKVHRVLSMDTSDNGFCLARAGVASVLLAQSLPNLEGWTDTLTTIDRISTAHYNIEIWNGSRFVPCDTFYERTGQYVGESGMYCLTRNEKANPYRLVLYFDQPNQRWLRGDWYGLCFLSSHAIGRDFEALCDSSTNDMLIPKDERWPLLYERPLVLASGILPYRAENPKWLRYSGVSSELIQLLSKKLNVSIREI